MIQTSAPSTDEPQAQAAWPSSGHHLVQWMRLLSAMAVAAMVFWYFGWWVARPIDPYAPVSLLMIKPGQGVIAMAELLGLAVVVSGLAVAICGTGSAERGPLAVAVGLATLALRGGQMDNLVLYRLTTEEAAGSVFPAWSLISETWLWLALIGVGFVVGRWVEGWFGGPRESSAERRGKADHGADIRQSVGTVAVACLIAWMIVLYTTGSAEMPLLKGQLYFSLILAFLIASLIAHWFFQTDTRIWTLLAIALVASAAYIYGQPSSETIEAARQAGGYVTLAPIARPVPIEFAALGGIGVLFEADIMALMCAMFGIGHAHPRATSS